MPRHREDVFPQSFEIALLGDVAEHDHAALQRTFRRTEYGRAETQDTPFARAQLDLLVIDARPRAKRIDDGDERFSDLACRHRPLLESLPLEWLAQDEARAVEAKELSGRPVQAHDRAPRINDQERVVHAREDRFQLQRVPFMLQGQLLRGAKTLDRDGGL